MKSVVRWAVAFVGILASSAVIAGLRTETVLGVIVETALGILAAFGVFYIADRLGLEEPSSGAWLRWLQARLGYGAQPGGPAGPGPLDQD